MAEQNSQEKTEQPTQRKLDKARNEGQMAFSHDLGAGLALFAAMVFLFMYSTLILSKLSTQVRTDLRISHYEVWTIEHTQRMFMQVCGVTLNIVLPLVVIVMVAGILASIMQNGFSISWKPLSPDIQRLSPMRGLSRLFSTKSVAKGVFAIAKLSLISLILWFVLKNEIADICLASDTHAREMTALTIAISIKAGFTAAIVLIALGIADVIYQKWQFNKDMRMSHQDIKQETKEDDGDPLLKARIRRVQREISQRRELAEVPSATVVIRNPTHFAVALRYERELGGAPKVVAKGKGFLALKIIDIAESSEVPVVENRPLAQSLFKTVEVGNEIPAELYAAVVEVLAYIYKLDRAS